MGRINYPCYFCYECDFMKRNFEIVECKGSGHPDTLTDTIVEDCATALELWYKNSYGKVLHYNLDKAVFLSGRTVVNYGGGKVMHPPKFILGGQAELYSEFVLEDSIRRTVKRVLPHLERFDIEIHTNSMSPNLKHITDQNLCNDTSFGVGYFPVSNMEIGVLLLKGTLDTIVKTHSDRCPIGEDYKIMATPKGIMVSAPLYANKVRSADEYKRIKARLERILGVTFNPDFDPDYPYLTLCGSSIECGDDGQVGRGNRYNGLITPCRPMSMEAYCGKNNQTHIGKLYNKMAYEKAVEMYLDTGKYTEVYLVGKIGKPINDYEMYVYHE